MPSSLILRNDAGRPMTPYPVLTNPPPPHREPDPANVVAQGAEQSIDLNGFNPAYYYEQVVLDPTKPNGFTVQMNLQQAPGELLVKAFHYFVPPGQEGQAAIELAEYPFLGLAEAGYRLTAELGLEGFTLQKVAASNGKGCVLLPFTLLPFLLDRL